MSDRFYQVIDNILSKPLNPLKRGLLQRVFNQGIPFNLPHGFKFLKIEDHEAILELPFKRKNKNHLGGVHACAMATLGEYPAGLLLIKNLGSKKYRVILKSLNVEYSKQGRESLLGKATISDSQIDSAKAELEKDGKALIEVKTEILAKSDQDIVAEVTTLWQLKTWESVTLK